MREFSATYQPSPSAEYQSMVATTWLWRTAPLPQTYWYQAYAQTNSDGQFDSLFGFSIYEHLMQVFTAVQRAGPLLTPKAVQVGLEDLTRPSPDTFSPPAAYAPGSHAFVTQQLLERWSSTDIAPGQSQTGCYVLIGNGTMHPPAGWPGGDHWNDPGVCGADRTNQGAEYAAFANGDSP
jgi:hypothetical protein